MHTPLCLWPPSPDSHAPPCVGKLHLTAPAYPDQSPGYAVHPRTRREAEPGASLLVAAKLPAGPHFLSLLPQPILSPGAKADPSEVQAGMERSSELLGASSSRGISLCAPILTSSLPSGSLICSSPSSASLWLLSLPQIATGFLPLVPSFQPVLRGRVFREPPP